MARGLTFGGELPNRERGGIAFMPDLTTSLA
jgi:hypothetical protein